MEQRYLAQCDKIFAVKSSYTATFLLILEMDTDKRELKNILLPTNASEDDTK